MGKTKKVSIDVFTLNAGAINELFVDEWDKVMDNIMDPNTKPELVREISIRIKIKPDASRRAATSTVEVKAKLANVKPHESFVYFEKESGKMVAYADDPNQGELELTEQDEKVVNLAERKA